MAGAESGATRVGCRGSVSSVSGKVDMIPVFECELSECGVKQCCDSDIVAAVWWSVSLENGF